MAIVQISKIQHRSGNLVDLPQLDEAEFGWALDQKRLFIGKTTPNENVEVLTAYSKITFSQIDGSVGNLNISNVTIDDGQVLVFDGNNWINRGGIAGGLITLGDVSNVKLTGGAVGYVLQTDGTGNLSWTPKGTLVSPILNVTKADPAVVTTDGDNFFTTGSQITIVDAQGMTELNGNIFYANVLTSTTFELYSDSSLTNPIDSTGYTAYAYTSVSDTTVGTNIITVGDSSSFTVGSRVQFLGNLSTSGISNDITYFVLDTPSSTTLQIATSNDANVSNVVALQTTTGLTANVYQQDGLAVSSLNAGINFSAAAGANTMVQYNDTGSMQGSASFTYNDTTKLLTVVGNANVSNLNSSGLVTATRFISNVSNGTTPIQVVSTDRVPNLNVSYANVSDYGVVTAQNSGIYYPIVVSGNTSANYALASNANFTFDLTNSLFTTNNLSVLSNANVGNISATTGIFTGNVIAGNANVSGQLISTVADGTAPFVVTSTTTVANLTASVAELSVNANVTSESTGVYYPVMINDSASGEYPLSANANISFNIATGTLTVDDLIVLNNTSATNSNVTNDLTVGNDIDVDGNATAAYFIGDGSQLVNLPIASILANGTSNASIPIANGNINLSVNGIPNVFVVTGTGANIAGNLSVTNDLSVSNILAISNITASNIVATGNLYTSNNIEVVKDARIAGNANVTANVNVVGNVNITSNLTTQQALVNQTLTAGNVEVGFSSNVGGNLRVAGNASIAGNAGITGTVSITGNASANNLTLTNTANIGANINVTGNSRVSGNSTVTGNLAVNGSSAINGNLSVVGNVTFTGTNISLGPINRVKVSGGSLGFLISTDGTGNLSFTDPDSLAAQPAGADTQIQFNDNGTMFANAGFTFNRLSGNFSVPGNATISQTISGSRLSISSNGTFGTNLTVNGLLTVNQLTTLNNNLNVAGETSTAILRTTSNIISGQNITANGLYYGNGSQLSSITGANVTGKVANAVYSDEAGAATTAVNATNATNATNAAKISVSPTATGVYYLTGATSTGSSKTLYIDSPALRYNADSGKLISSIFSGSGAELTNIPGANVTGTVPSATTATRAGTVTAGAQSNITSVGTLTSLNVAGALSAGGGISTTGIVASGNTDFSSGTQFTGDIIESVSISGVNLSSTAQVNLLGPSIKYYTNNPTSNWVFNFRGNSSVPTSSYLSPGKSVTNTLLVPQGSTAYYVTSVRIDGTPVSVKWLGGVPPTAGNPNSIDAYTFTIMMISAGSYVVFGSLTKYSG